MSSRPNAFFASAKRRAISALFRDVGLHRDGLGRLADDLGNDAVGPFLAGGVVDDNGRALGGQMLGDGGADPLGCAR